MGSGWSQRRKFNTDSFALNAKMKLERVDKYKEDAHVAVAVQGKKSRSSPFIYK